MQRKHHHALAALLALIGTSALGETRSLDPAAVLPAKTGRTSDFLAVDLGTGTRCELAGSDLSSRHAPWSSFKIPNYLIALETGAAPAADHWREWNPDRRPAASYWPEAWRQGQTLNSAFERSAAWYFQDVAEAVSGPVYREILGEWGYGNAAAPDGNDGFWLGGPLAVSVEEQVAFVGGLLTGDLDVAPEHLLALEAASEDGSSVAGAIHGKTGSGPLVPGEFDGAFEGWYVGWQARPDSAPIAFAHYVQADSYTDLRSYRRDEAVKMLEACGF